MIVKSSKGFISSSTAYSFRVSGQILGTLVIVDITDITLQDSGAVSATSDAGAETETDGEASSR